MTDKKPATPLKSYGYVECRTFGHSWKPRRATKSPLFGTYLWLECTTCEMLRMDTIDSRGQVAARSYSQPESYKNPEVDQRAEYRMEMLRRIHEHVIELPDQRDFEAIARRRKEVRDMNR